MTTQNRIEKIANEIAFDDQDASLSDLRGGVHFSPKFDFGKTFIVYAMHGPNDGIYVRNPYGGETFRRIRLRDVAIELDILHEHEETIKPFSYFTGSYSHLIRELIRGGKFHYKVIT